MTLDWQAGILQAVDQKDVFAIALGLTGPPWKVVEVRFNKDLQRLNIDLD